MALPRLLLFWLSDTVTELLHRASNARMPPTQSPITHTCIRKGYVQTLKHKSPARTLTEMWAFASLNEPPNRQETISPTFRSHTDLAVK